MKVTYVGQQSQIRMVYLNICGYNVNSSSTVELRRATLWQNKEVSTVISPTFSNYTKYSTVAIINLAPGEYLDWSEDEIAKP